MTVNTWEQHGAVLRYESEESIFTIDDKQNVLWNYEIRCDFSGARDLRSCVELAALISDLSEECRCSAWDYDMPYDLWVTKTPRPIGQGDVTQEHIDTARRLSESCGGWVVWEFSDEGPRWVPSDSVEVET